MKILIVLGDYLNTVVALEMWKHSPRTWGKLGEFKMKASYTRAESLVQRKVFLCADFTCVLLWEHVKLSVT